MNNKNLNKLLKELFDYGIYVKTISPYNYDDKLKEITCLSPDKTFDLTLFVDIKTLDPKYYELILFNDTGITDIYTLEDIDEALDKLNVLKQKFNDKINELKPLFEKYNIKEFKHDER